MVASLLLYLASNTFLWLLVRFYHTGDNFLYPARPLLISRVTKLLNQNNLLAITVEEDSRTCISTLKDETPSGVAHLPIIALKAYFGLFDPKTIIKGQSFVLNFCFLCIHKFPLNDSD